MSTTDHGPSNHEDDLGRALRDLVDDASLPGLDAHLDVVRGRTRRRRAAKKVALGATTLCVAGALGIAAVSLPQDARPEPIAPARSPSATSSPTPASLPTFPTPLTAQALECQQPAPTPTGDRLPALLSIDAAALTVQNLELVDTTVTTTFTDDARITLAGEKWSGAYVVVQDGVIVSSLLPLPETDGPLAPEPGSSVTQELSVDSFASCDPEGLNDHSPSMLPGDYQVFALSRFQLDSWAPVGPDGTVGPETTGALYDGWLVSEPVPLTITPATDTDPVALQDVLLTDTSAVYASLRQAAEAGDPVALDLLVDPSRIPVADGPYGTWTLTVAPNASTGERQRTTSDDGWTLVLRGGAPFSAPAPSGLAFSRFVGTYDVLVDDSGATPTISLQVIEGGMAVEAPATKDREVCDAYIDASRGVDTAGGPLGTYMDDLVLLAGDTVPAADSSLYRELRARWISSPSAWWSIVHGVDLMRTTDVGGDSLALICEGS
ncbi:hypothetical protein [Oerskovia rustica]|uniref:Uncharacterized protein n=1 Tax=Oerskovia rustica TaxID=2762237 RepID=A0ABR8RRK3_9CELL|nr:hypothetical protein [Oerskovia rustica]MBD7950424.1 hypothetical protein [Oerskovia rustica]